MEWNENKRQMVEMLPFYDPIQCPFRKDLWYVISSLKDVNVWKANEKMSVARFDYMSPCIGYNPMNTMYIV